MRASLQALSDLHRGKLLSQIVLTEQVRHAPIHSLTSFLLTHSPSLAQHPRQYSSVPTAVSVPV